MQFPCRKIQKGCGLKIGVIPSFEPHQLRDATRPLLFLKILSSAVQELGLAEKTV